jgi:Zn-dependent protease
MEVFLMVTVGWIFSVCLHEFGHAFIAYKGGDYTVKEKGYLTLNPIHYTHPLYSLVMPLVFLMMGGIGLPGGAVYINDQLIRSKGWRTAVSLAGPAMNVLLVIVLCVPFWLGLSDTRFAAPLAFLIQLEISAVLLNLLPVPPLDGFRAFMPWLPAELGQRLLQQSTTALWILFLLMWYVQPLNAGFWYLVRALSNALGIDPALADLGWHEFRFWKK